MFHRNIVQSSPEYTVQMLLCLSQQSVVPQWCWTPVHVLGHHCANVQYLPGLKRLTFTIRIFLFQKAQFMTNFFTNTMHSACPQKAPPQIQLINNGHHDIMRLMIADITQRHNSCKTVFNHVPAGATHTHAHSSSSVLCRGT